MKIKAKKYEPSHKIIKVDNYEFVLDEKTMVRTNNYIPIMAMQFNDDGSMNLITTLLDKNYNNAKCPKEKIEVENAGHMQSIHILGPEKYFENIFNFIEKY